MPRFALPSIVVLLLVWPLAPAAEANPYNIRQSAEGYWVSGAPVAEDGEYFGDAGITLLVGATFVDRATRNEFEPFGVEWVRVEFQNTRPSTDLLLEVTEGVPPEQILLHCEYGADRSGAMLAFLLVARHGWAPDHAFLAVVYAGGRDEANLVLLLEELGFVVTDEERLTYAGIYSGDRNGGSGGLKVRGEGYRTLISRTMDAMLQHGGQTDVEVLSGDPMAPGHAELPEESDDLAFDPGLD